VLRAAAAAAFAGLVAACASEPQTAAPVIQKGGVPGMAEGAAAPPTTPRRTEARRIVVRPGQSLGRIAHEYHVPERAIIAANHLKPPYKIEAGQRLLIPAVAGPPAPIAVAAVPPPAAAGHPPPDIIPLDGPPPAKPAAAPPAGSSPAPAIAVPRKPPEPSAAEEARAEDAAHEPRKAAPPRGGHLSWPVQGRVLAGYGVGSGGAHNDGINIAAPRGAPVRAVEGGVVAYAGNELRGYGNLVLVKHPDGFITAYAHCEELLVKRGEKVSRGQVIAKVGATGGVGEPQLHFELRRGKKAVDPREILGPAPSAASGAATRHG
jgi:murein DD-endopeptidase MepM/ murein hydrolase activator NlpD